LLTDVPVKRIKDFEAQFLLEMESKMPELLADFKKGLLPEEGIKNMLELVKGLIPQFK
jgi:F-type H+-transporting ATPase subunit alpha